MRWWWTARRDRETPGDRRAREDQLVRRLEKVDAEILVLLADTTAAARKRKVDALVLARDDLLMLVADAAGVEVGHLTSPLAPQRRRDLENACQEAGRAVPPSMRATVLG